MKSGRNMNEKQVGRKGKRQEAGKSGNRHFTSEHMLPFVGGGYWQCHLEGRV